jgi:hypothetical protein
MTLKFLRNKVVETEPLEDGNIAISWRLTDDLHKIEVHLVVQPPDLEIIEADAEFKRHVPRSCIDASEQIKKIIGVSVGGGLRKIVTGLLNAEEGCSMLADAVLESCNAVILNFTRPGIEMGEDVTDPDQKLEGLRAMIQSNPRLIRSCISFQDNSPIMKGLNL